MQAEGADAKLVLGTRDPKQRLELVFLPNAELHVCHGEIELGEEARTARLVDKLVDVRQRLHRLLRDGVQSAVVLKKAPRAVLLPREHDRGSVRSAGRDNPALIEQKGHLFAALVKLALRPALHREGARHRVRASVDAEFKRGAAVRREARWWASEDVTVLGCQRRKVRGVRLKAGPFAAKVMLLTKSSVPSGSVVLVSARPASVSSAQAAPARAATAVGQPEGGTHCDGRPGVGAAPKPTSTRRVCASVAERRVAGDIDAARLRSRRTLRLDVPQPRSVQKQTSLAS
jgi:hypothetical protein